MPDRCGWPTFDEWRAGLGHDERSRLDSIADELRRAGAREPEDWARSEVSEGIAQSARYAFLRAIWHNLDRWREDEFVDRYLDATGVSPTDDEDRSRARRAAAYSAFQATLDVILTIDHATDVESEGNLPGWRLMEVDVDGEMTGRYVGGLHESMLDVDPRGIEAEDIRGGW